MQTFQTAAVVGLVDELSGPLKALANNAQRVVKQLSEMKIASSGSGLNQYNDGLAKANTLAREHVGLLQRIKSSGLGTAATFGAMVATSAATHKAVAAVKNFAPYDIAQRFQEVVGRNNPEHPYSDKDVASLAKQRYQVADKWGLQVDDTLEAQDVFVKRGKSSDVVRGATDAAIISSKAFGVSAKEGGANLENWLFSSRIPLENYEQARKESLALADKFVRVNKSANVTSADLSQAGIYGAGASYGAGISINQQLALIAAEKMAGVDGTQSGTMNRAVASSLIAPTIMGKAALSMVLKRANEADGGDRKYEDYYKPAGSMSGEAMDAALKLNGGGKGLGAKGIEFFNAAVQKSVKDMQESDDPNVKSVLDTRESRSNLLRQALEASGQTFDKGEVKSLAARGTKVMDLEAERSKLGELRDLMIKYATQGEVIATLGSKQGGRLQQADPAKYFQILKELEQSEGLATKVATERSTGLGFELERLKNTMDGLSKSAVNSNSSLIESGLRMTANAATWATNQNAVVQGGLAAALWAGSVIKDTLPMLIGMGVAKKLGLFGATEAAVAATATAGGAGAAAVGAAEGAALGASVSSISIAGPVTLLAAGVALTMAAANMTSQQSDDQLKATMNSFPDDNALAAAIMLAGRETHADDESYGLNGTHNSDGPRDPVGQAVVNAVTAVGTAFKDAFTLGVGDMLLAVQGRYAETAAAQANRRAERYEWEQANPHHDDESYGLKGTGSYQQPAPELAPIQNYSPAEPIKIETTPLQGDITGTAKVESTITVEPSEWFKILVRKIEGISDMAMAGKLGTTISGSNGAVPSKPGGIGHQ